MKERKLTIQEQAELYKLARRDLEAGGPRKAFQSEEERRTYQLYYNQMRRRKERER